MKLIRITLGILLAFAALNAFGGGWYGMAGAEGVPVEWLTGTLFRNYFIPGLILFTLVGIPFLISSVMVFADMKYAREASFASVAIVMTWLIAELAIIGYVSWMQPVTAVVAMIILSFTYFWKK